MVVETPETGNAVPVPAEVVAQKVREVVADALELALDEVELSSSFFELGAESLDLLDMAFRLEREFKIQFPRTDILERATEHFGEDALVADGVVTDFGLQLLRRGMPELDPAQLKPDMLAVEVAQMITVQSFVRIVMRLIEAKAEFPRDCPACGATMEESDIMPEFVCPACDEMVPLPSGDEILLQDLIDLTKEPEA